jgi:sorbitol/mannitol transport system permease protein
MTQTTSNSSNSDNSKRKRDEQISDTMLRRILIWPAIIYMIIVTQVPLLFTLRFSLERWNMNRPDRRGFTGLDNFVDVITDADFWTIIGNTAILTGAVVLITFALGLMFALLLNRNFAGRGIVRTMLITPFLIMPTVSAIVWKNVLLDPSFGFITKFVESVGFPTPDFLGHYPMASVIVIVVWQWTPFMMLILLAGLQSLSHEQIEASQIDGANPLHMLRYIVLAHLQRYIEIAVLINTFAKIGSS